MDKVIYRHAREGECAELFRLFLVELSTINEKKREPYDLTKFKGDYFKRFFREGGHTVLAAEADGKLVGYAALELLEAGKCHADEPFVYLDDFSVDADYRGMGIGSHLLTWMEEYAREMGRHELRLHTDETNDRALKLYRRFGYTFIVPEGPRWLFGKRID